MRKLLLFSAALLLFGCGGSGTSLPPVLESPFVGLYGGESYGGQTAYLFSVFDLPQVTISPSGALTGSFSYPPPTWFAPGTIPTTVSTPGTVSAQVSPTGVLTGTYQVSGQPAAPLTGNLAFVQNGTLSGLVQWGSSKPTYLYLNPMLPTPTITSISPNPVTVGGNLTITGTNLTGSTTLVHIPAINAYASVYATSGNSTSVVASIGISPGTYQIAVSTSQGMVVGNGLSNTVTMVVK